MPSAIQTRGDPTRLCPPPETDADRLTAVQSGLYSPSNINHNAPLLVATGRCA